LGDANPAWDVSASGTSFLLGSDETTVCYTLELTRLVDDAVLAFPERCVERPDDLMPGVYPTDPETIRGRLASCDVPPAGYDEEWCSGLEALRAQSGIESYFVKFTDSCPLTGGPRRGPAGAGCS
jgi:hypothetical protein